ncbi:MAG TPA: A/G-specific adenine glycosylase [Steroidobacteraceae bacterium]|jgi:A/G-specific adenine glycosylase|nr:A/G-specific adenine glycosylase [Steroidobacteraceae bacterium]
MTETPAQHFGQALIAWQATHGRHDLPWQQDRTPYRVWVSEIMLQQTQVATVIGYFGRFMARFPDPASLAAASIDEVLHLWTGLGYYARGRNLHRAAIRIRDEFGGRFPTQFEAVESLPGIGRSTAGAILALSQGQRFAIMDGNVRRVLSRWFGIDGNPIDRATTDLLWNRAQECTPRTQVETYTQAIMDMGATLCTRRNPLCMHCPVSDQCVARITGRQHELPPTKSKRAIRRARHTHMVLAQRPDGSVLLRQRPPAGIWGGLWAAPAFDSADEALGFAAENLAGEPIKLPPIQHAFTHFDLTITPWLVRCNDRAVPGTSAVMDAPDSLWYNAREPASVGLPAPMKSLLERIDEEP